MTELFNRAVQKGRRRFLRSNLTKAERILWSKLNRRQLLGHKFRRQYSIGPYVVDFYCAETQLAIELDTASRPRPRQVHRIAWNSSDARPELGRL
jgi:very-short-patch-repair endonuclease